MLTITAMKSIFWRHNFFFLELNSTRKKEKIAGFANSTFFREALYKYLILFLTLRKVSNQSYELQDLQIPLFLETPL